MKKIIIFVFALLMLSAVQAHAEKWKIMELRIGASKCDLDVCDAHASNEKFRTIELSAVQYKLLRTIYGMYNPKDYIDIEFLGCSNCNPEEQELLKEIMRLIAIAPDKKRS